MKMFKAKKVKKKKKSFKIIFIILFLSSYIACFTYFYNNKKNSKKNLVLDNINYVNFNIVDYINNTVDDLIKKPSNFLNNSIKKANKLNIKSTNSKTLVYKENKIDNEYKPVIYVYNTHQTEKYTDYSVYEASKYLTDKLNNNIGTYFEEKSIAEYLALNNLKYYKSYMVSKKYLTEAKEKYSTLNYYFDIHRDSVDKEKSTLIYNNLSYAKILFLIGLDNLNYEANLENAKKLNEIIEKKVPGISRGILKKQGKKVDGVYNQDVSSNVFLIEVGALYNNKDEVIRTLDVIYDAINEYIGNV